MRRIIVALCVASLSGLVVAASPTTRPLTPAQELKFLREENTRLKARIAELESQVAALKGPTTRGVVIVKGMTLKDAEQIAEQAAQVVERDDDGTTLYSLSVMVPGSGGPTGGQLYDDYFLTVGADGKIIRFRSKRRATPIYDLPGRR
jgi:hypothetical protein